MKRNDWILAGGVLAISLVLLFFQMAGSAGSSGEGTVEVTVAGERYGSYSLREDGVYEIGDTNRLVIRDGSARIQWADCPDQICVRHRAVSRDGESIICLPNQMVVSVHGGEESELDGITQ